MFNHLCDVCGLREPLGVASTVIPYSCAYCLPCLRVNAQPEMVFEVIFDNIGTDFDRANPAYLDLVTYHNGDYIDYRTWALNRKERS